MRYLLVFIYFFASFCHSNEIDASKIEFTTIDQLTPLNERPPIPNPRPAPPRRKRDHFEPPKFIAMLKKNSIVIAAESGKEFRITKPMYVMAKETYMGSDKAYLLGKNETEIYQTHMTNLVSIQDDTDLLPGPKIYKTFPPRNKKLADDKKLKLENMLKFQQEFVSLGRIADSLEIDSTLATGQRLGVTSLFHSGLPFQFGLVANYEQASWNSISNWKAFYAGPVIKMDIFRYQDSVLKGIFGYEQSLFFNLNVDQEQISLSGGALLLEVDYTFPTRFGTFLVGFAARFMQAKISSTNHTLPTEDRKSINSYCLTIGYSFDLNI